MHIITKYIWWVYTAALQVYIISFSFDSPDQSRIVDEFLLLGLVSESIYTKVDYQIDKKNWDKNYVKIITARTYKIG